MLIVRIIETNIIPNPFFTDCHRLCPDISIWVLLPLNLHLISFHIISTIGRNEMNVSCMKYDYNNLILIETAMLTAEQNIFMMFIESNWKTLIRISFALPTFMIHCGLSAKIKPQRVKWNWYLGVVDGIHQLMWRQSQLNNATSSQSFDVSDCNQSRFLQSNSTCKWQHNHNVQCAWIFHHQCVKWRWSARIQRWFATNIVIKNLTNPRRCATNFWLAAKTSHQMLSDWRRSIMWRSHEMWHKSFQMSNTDETPERRLVGWLMNDKKILCVEMYYWNWMSGSHNYFPWKAKCDCRVAQWHGMYTHRKRENLAAA
jgi:hypothetical protein